MGGGKIYNLHLLNAQDEPLTLQIGAGICADLTGEALLVGDLPELVLASSPGLPGR